MALCEGPYRFKPRYQLPANVHVAISTEADTCPAQPIDARLVYLSRAGVKLAVSESPALDENAQLKLSLRESGVEFRVDGKVCWKTQIDKHVWNLGCSLSPPLPEQLFAMLTEGSPMERSCDPRLPSSLQTTARWDLDKPELPVVIHGFSTGGFCVWIDVAGEPHERLHLSIASAGSTLMVVAQVQWQSKTDNGYLIGCSFLNDRDHERLQGLF